MLKSAKLYIQLNWKIFNKLGDIFRPPTSVLKLFMFFFLFFSIAFVFDFQYVLKVTGVTIVHRPAAVSQPTLERVTVSLVTVIVSMVGLEVPVMLILMNVIKQQYTSVRTTQSVITPMDHSTVSVIQATLKLEMPLVKVLVLCFLIFLYFFF